jgi:hypothetical protein
MILTWMTGFPASLTTPSEQLCFLAIIGFHPPDVLEEINYSMYMVLKGGFFFHWVEEKDPYYDNFLIS